MRNFIFKAIYIVLFTLVIILTLSSSVKAFDFPDCENTLPPLQTKLMLGFDLEESDLLPSLLKHSLLYQDVTLCKAESKTAFNNFVPWSQSISLEQYYGWAVFAFGFLVAVFAYFILPARWKGTVTLLGLLFIAGLTWVIASALLFSLHEKKIPQTYLYTQLMKVHALHGVKDEWVNIRNLRDFDALLNAQDIPIREKFVDYRFRLISDNAEDDVPQKSNEPEVSSFSYQIVEQKYENSRRKVKLIQLDFQGKQQGEEIWFNAEDIDFSVHHINFKNKVFVPRQPLNIRKGPSMNYERLNQALSVDSKVIPTGKAFGDWWEVVVDNSNTKGWVSSLWLQLAE